METSFNFNIPLDIISKADEEEWRIGGIASTEDKDFQGEIVKIDGLDITTLATSGFFNQDHKKGFENILGKIDFAEKRENPEVGKHLYIEGKLFKTQPAAQAAWNIIKELGDSGKKMQLSVEGKIQKREGKDKKIITKAKVENVALTLNPINEKTFATFIKSFEEYENEETQQSNDSFSVTLSKSTVDKLYSYMESKKTFKDHLIDLSKGLDQKGRDKLFNAFREAKKKYEKSLETSYAYANQLPQQMTQGDVMTSESLERKKKAKKDKIKEITKSFNAENLDTVLGLILSKIETQKVVK